MAKRAPSKRGASAQVTFTGDERICVIHGPEDMVRRERFDQLRQTIAKKHGEFETFHLDGERATLAEVFDELRSYSLMQQYKLVVVDQADQFVKTHRQALERYAENPVDHATLVLRSTVWNKGKKLDDRIAKVGQIVKCEAMDARAARGWLVERAKTHHAAELAERAAGALVDRLGTDLTTLDTELGKLAAAAGDGQIDVALIELVVGLSSEAQAYEAQEATLRALVSGNAGPLIEKLHELIDLAGQPEALVHYFVADVLRKLNQGLMMKRAGVPTGQIARQLRMWGQREQLFAQAMQRFDGRRAGALFDQVIEADARSKSGFGQALRNLECFCARLADVSG